MSRTAARASREPKSAVEASKAQVKPAASRKPRAAKPAPAEDAASAFAGPVAALGFNGAIAGILAERARRPGARPILYVSRSASEAVCLHAILEALHEGHRVAYLPPWDVPPLEGVEPSRAVTGRRMSVLRWLTDAEHRPAITVTTTDAILRRVPPRSLWEGAHHVEFRVGDPIDLEALEADLLRIGYSFDGRVDEAGEVAFRGRVVDIFPAAAPRPCRVEHENGRVTQILSYDPATQRSLEPTEHLIVDPASEIVLPAAEAQKGGARAHPAERENRLAEFYGHLDTVFDYLPDAELFIEEGAGRRVEVFLEQAREALELGRRASGAARRLPKLESVFLTKEERGALFARDVVIPVVSKGGDRHVPRFASERAPNKAFAAFAREHADKRLVLAAPNAPVAAELRRRARRVLKREIAEAATWEDLRAAEPGAVLSMILPVDRGSLAPETGTVIVAAADLLGSFARAPGGSEEAAAAFGVDALSPGDVVVHMDHGLGVLDGVETVEADGVPRDVLSLRYRDGAKLMVPVGEIGALWRYGGEEEAVTLDRLTGEAWIKRRNEMVREIEKTARVMAELGQKRARAKGLVVESPRQKLERFAEGFPYELTAGQRAALDAILADLASGRPMDRLLCGDVGFGKTEVALRAVAAVVFAGGQVALAAPTTVLARQHLRNLARRFAPFGLEVAELSRMTDKADQARVKTGLADGSIPIVVGTHTLAAEAVAFRNLVLLVVDEEQRFGTRDKDRLREKAKGGHVLTLTATPIPRTLESAFVGLHDVSVITTAPVNRQPVRTEVRAFDDDLVREALGREAARGGQSFVVCPRVEDIEPMARRLARIAPDLKTVTAHGKLAPDEIDRVMLGFAEGEGDVLLATNIVESGIDVPSANTLVVWRPDRFGLSQLHQLRGRVGRSARRGLALLLTDPDETLSEGAERRLASLAELSALGSGFAISARDLDLRGAGDLLGETQAGHMKLLGLDLYRHYLDLAFAKAETGRDDGDWRPEIALGLPGRIPPDYVPDAGQRIALYRRIDRLTDAAEVAKLEAEIADRFGTPPHEVQVLLSRARLRAACANTGIAKLEGGPAALAVTFRAGTESDEEVPVPGAAWKNNRLIVPGGGDTPPERLALAEELVATLSDR